MNTEEIISKFDDKNILLVKVKGSTDLKDSEHFIYPGDLTEYIEVLKKLKIEVAFLFSKIFDEDELSAEFNFNYEDESESIPVQQFFKEIKEYEKYVDKECEFKIIAKGSNFELIFFSSEPWWDEFNKNEYLAFEEFYKNETQKIDRINESFNQKKEHIIETLDELLEDDKFIKLKNQKAMYVYIKENIPEVNDLFSEEELRPEIQRLSATINARNLK